MWKKCVYCLSFVCGNSVYLCIMLHVDACVCEATCLWLSGRDGKGTKGICPEVWAALITVNSILISVVNNSFHTHCDFSFSLTFLCRIVYFLFTCKKATYWIHRHGALHHIHRFSHSALHFSHGGHQGSCTNRSMTCLWQENYRSFKTLV